MNYINAKKRKASLRSLIFVTALAASFLSCQFQFSTTNPVTGRNELTFITEADEVEIGEEVFEMMLHDSGGRYTDNPALSAYVNSVGQKLAKLSDRPNLPYEFVIVNDDTLNAWALPGGKIAINKGLLLLMENEAELAAVLAHEITHAAARHTAERWERHTVRPAVDAVEMIFNPTHSLVIATEFTADVIEMKYSRDAENEADRYGLEYMARAGYDVSAAKTVHEKLHQTDEVDSAKSLVDTLLSSHPEDGDRIYNIDQLSILYPEKGILNEIAYQEKTAALRKA